jgi:hypothetical protein
MNEKVVCLMNAVGYGQSRENIIGSGNKDLKTLFRENYQKFATKNGKLQIKFYDVLNGIGTLTVNRWNNNTFDEKYYEATNVPITGDIPKPDKPGQTTTLDGRIYLQTHWGSGVTFRDIKISGL